MRYAFKYTPVLLVVLTLIALSLTVLADGRVNVVHHFGGDVLYCVDEKGASTNDYETMLEAGGMQLLAMNGERLLFVPAAIIQEKGAEAQPGGGNVLVAEGQGTYGPAAIYVYKMTDGTIHFIFVGMDEHGKGNQVDFQHCLPVNAPANNIEAGSATGLSYPPAGCYYSAVYALYIIWEGNQTQSTINMTWDGTCATPPHTGVGGFFLVSTADAASAAALCTTRGYVFIDEVSSASDTGAWAIYRCQI